MNYPLSGATSFLCCSLLLSDTAIADTKTTVAFTDDQKAQIGEIAANWLVEHPEYLVAATESLRQQQELAQIQMQKSLVLSHANMLLVSDGVPSVGADDVSIVAVIFFDYQCCANGSDFVDIISRLVKENPHIRFIFRDYPMLTSRWPASGYAARVGLHIYNTKGVEAYLKYFNTLMSNDSNAGEVTEKIIEAAAGANYDKKVKIENEINKIQEYIDQNLSLGKELQLHDPFSVIIMPVKNIDVENITVLSGTITESLLRRAFLRYSKTKPLNDGK